MIPVLAFGLLMVLVLGVNPFLRLSTPRASATVAGLALLCVPLQILKWSSAYFAWTVSADFLMVAAVVALAMLVMRLPLLWSLLLVVALVLINVPLWFETVAFYFAAEWGWVRFAQAWTITGGLLRIAGGVVVVVLALRLIVFVLSLPFGARSSGFIPLSRAELMCIFTAMLVTAGVSTFGLSSQLVPLLPAPYNPQWNTPQRDWASALLPGMRSELYISDTDAITKFNQGVTIDRYGERIEVPKDTAGLRVQARYWGRVFMAIPWALWVPPLIYWLILIAGVYGLFYSLTYVVLPYWRDREKLIFPLARLPEALLPDEHKPGAVPSIFRGPAFWIGFAISAGVLMWNGLALNGAVDASYKVILGMSRNAVDAAIANTVWEGLGSDASFGLMFLIIFTAIGIAFLLPLEISFSIWFYFLVGKAIILITVWMGYGRVAGDFPSDWLWFNNPVTAQGGGGLFLFSALSLYRCLKDYVHLVRGRSVGDAVRIAMPVVGLVVSLLVITAWLQWNHIGWGWAMLITLTLTLLTVGLMRIVAEGGVYWFQSHTSFFHLYKMFGVGKFLPAPLLAPLIPIYSVLFLDIKTFMAPNLLNAGAMQRDVGGSRAKFHLSIVLSVAASVVLSLGFAIFLAHLWGGQAMHGWFYVQGPSSMLDTARDATREVAQFNPVNSIWWGVGAVWVALSMYLRTWLFWFPHPIGYIMLINPLMSQLWFSFFIGWMCKKVVVQYGGKNTFDKVRGVFIGLILGELLAIVFWLTLSLVYTGVKSAGIDLNRYS
jgi:hypothetical protein